MSIIKMKIVAINKHDKYLLDIWDKEAKENNQEPYNFDKIEIDFEGKYADFIDSRYYKKGKFHNKHVLAPIRVPFNELDFINIQKL